MKIGYNTEKGRAVAEEVMKAIKDVGHETSVELAKEKGCFPNWNLSVFKESGVPRRNAAITNIAPTGTISMMLNVSGGVEVFKYLLFREPLFLIEYFFF